ncbi:MAG: phenylalanine--tRNA ligase beta subunit-related protein [Acidobacteriota bacterium]
MSDVPQPLAISYQLDGWRLFIARLEATDADADRLAELRSSVSAAIRQRLDIETLSSHPTVAALRSLFKAAGCSPSRYRPSSEALLRRLLKGQEMPAINPLVDLNNCLSAELAVPCCVMAEGTFTPPLTLRAGQPGEAYDSLRGPFNLERKPLLLDAEGPLDTPITGSQRVKVSADTRVAWLAAYLPADVVSVEQAGEALEQLLSRAAVARVT